MAASWIEGHAGAWSAGEALTLAMHARDLGLIGAIALRLAAADEQGELSYWVGAPFWNRGYASEAALRMLDFGFRDLGLRRIHAHHMVRNPASGRVMRKIGMRQEGVMRQAVKIRGAVEDVAHYAILRDEWDTSE